MPYCGGLTKGIVGFPLGMLWGIDAVREGRRNQEKGWTLGEFNNGNLSTWAHDAEVNGVFYNLDDYGRTASVTYKGDSEREYENENAAQVVIPESVVYNGITYSVKSLGYGCFAGCYGLTSITIPNSVTNLQDCCFYQWFHK